MNGSSSRGRTRTHRLTRTDRRVRRSAAFTLVEALLAIAFTATAGSVLLLGIGGSLQTTSDILHETIAQGMAQQLIDEVVGIPLEDVDDYNTRGVQPPTDPWGIELGKDDGAGGTRHVNFWAPTARGTDGVERVAFFQDWRQEVDVLAGPNSQSRTIEVRIAKAVAGGGFRELARLRRVVTYE